MKTRALVPIASLLLLCGCATLDPTVPPDVSLVDLRFENLSLFETTAVFTLRIANENPFPLSVDGGAYKLTLNGRNVGKGLSNARLDLPRLATATDQVTVHIGNLSLFLGAMDLRQRNEVDYSVTATLYVRHETGRTRRLRSSHSGTVRLPENQTRALQQFEPAGSHGAATVSPALPAQP